MTTKPKVLHRNSIGVPRDAVYVGRPTKWGNPYLIGRDGTRKAVIWKYQLWLEGNEDLLAALPELRGKTLTCWCAPRACHADILLEKSND
ncbi:hypothetical protein LCGC14_2055700 [marine sediment metagenome]|uniref:DUF4326 domain-containing protein n=1 Tax=marine sediment metagenome TaxID=412755 RepID=A0A0F9HJP9_9ZZZZ